MLCISQWTQFVVNICFVFFLKCSILLRDIFWYCLFIECIQAKCMIVQNLESSYVIYDSYAKNSLNELFIKDVFWKINSCTWPFSFDISMAVLLRHFHRKRALLPEKSSGRTYNNLVNNRNVEFTPLLVIKITRN